MAVRVLIEDDQLMVERVQRQGFPSREAPPPPPRPPAPFAFYAKDRLIGLTWVQGERAEFLRDADGAIGWIRIGGRVARRALIIRP